jgi:phage FluMu protein Com
MLRLIKTRVPRVKMMNQILLPTRRKEVPTKLKKIARTMMPSRNHNKRKTSQIPKSTMISFKSPM